MSNHQPRAAKTNVTNVCVLARPFAKLVSPPTVRHQAETSTTPVTDLMLVNSQLSHYVLASRFGGITAIVPLSNEHANNAGGVMEHSAQKGLLRLRR